MLTHILGSSLHALADHGGQCSCQALLSGGAVGARSATHSRYARPSTSSSRNLPVQFGCRSSPSSATSFLAAHGIHHGAPFGAALLLPLTFLIGTTFPLAIRILAVACR